MMSCPLFICLHTFVSHRLIADVLFGLVPIITHRRTLVGIPAPVILSMTEHESMDLFSMGSRGLGTIKEHLIGSVSLRVATHAFRHVLLVKAPVVSFNNILLLLEHPLDAESVIELLSQKPCRGTPHVTVLHVIPFAQPILPNGALFPDSWKKEVQAGGAR